MERRMRGTKREIKAAKAGRVIRSLRSDYDYAALKLTRKTEEYQNFCAANGLKTQWKRTYVNKRIKIILNI